MRVVVEVGHIVLFDVSPHHEPVEPTASVRAVGVGLVERNDDNGVAGRWVQMAAIKQRLENIVF